MTKEEIQQLQSALSASWPLLKPWLERERSDWLNKLVDANDEEARGRIKELDDILNLPDWLQSESVGFQQVQEEEGLP